MALVYPTNDLDRPAILLNLLGSHWSETYEGQFLVERIAFAMGQVEKQTQLDLQETIDCLSRFKVPVYHTDRWYELRIKESELNNTQAAMLTFGEGAVYGRDPVTGVEYLYGVPTSSLFVFPLPAALRDVNLISNRITDPSATWLQGIDFQLNTAKHAIIFRENPFTNDLVAKTSVYVDGVVVDREASLWLHMVKFEQNQVYTQFGYALDLRMASSEGYRDLVNAIWNGLVGGTAKEQVEQVLSALTDVPIVIEETETVEEVITDSQHLLVITDQHVYRFHTEATALVAAGDVVRAGDQLTNAVQFYEFNRGQLSDDLLALTLPQGFLISGYYGEISFYNREVPLVVDTTGTLTKVSFEVGGWPLDVEKFWDDMHERGVTAGHTLAQLLDQRVNKVGEPTAAALPATINPLRFLVENVLRNNVFAVKVRPNLFGSRALSLGYARELRRLIPPHTAMLLLVELAAEDDLVTMDADGDETRPGYAEDPELYRGLEPVEEEIVPVDFIDEEPTARYIDIVCH